MENGSEQSRAPLAVEAEKFVVDGLRYVKQEKFEEACTYFRNLQKAKRLGLRLTESPRQYIIGGAMTREKEKHALDFCLRNSFFFRGDSAKGERPMISLVEVSTKSLGGRLPKTLWHELALIGAEEWTHALQYLQGSSLTGEQNNEIDVAAYFAQKGIPLTKDFLRRHKRKEGLLHTK